MSVILVHSSDFETEFQGKYREAITTIPTVDYFINISWDKRTARKRN